MLMLINGEHIPSVTGKTFDNINPATGVKVNPVRLMELGGSSAEEK